MSKLVLFQTIQFSISTEFSSIGPRDGTQPGASTMGQRGPRSDGNEGVLRIPQSSCILEPHHIFLSYPRHSLEAVLPLCRGAVGLFYSASRLSHRAPVGVVLPLSREAVGVFSPPPPHRHGNVLVLFVSMMAMLLLTAVISHSLLFLMWHSSSRIGGFTQFSFLSSLLPPSILDTYNLCHLLNVKPCASLSTDLSPSPFVLWFICLSSSLVHLKNGSKCLTYLPTPLLGQDMTQGQFLAGFNRFELRIFLLQDKLPHQGKEPSLPYYLHIAVGRIIWFLPFLRVLVLCKMHHGHLHKYLTRITAQVFIPLTRYLLQSLILISFLVRTFCFFSLVSSCLMMTAFNIPSCSLALTNFYVWAEGFSSQVYIKTFKPYTYSFNNRRNERN